MVPIYQVFWVLMNILSGMMYFQEYAHMPWLNILLFIVGCVRTTLCAA